MPMPTLSSVHVNAALSNVAIGYKNQQFVMGNIFPVVNVAKESDYYHIWTQADIFRNEAAVIRPGALAPRGGFSLSNTTYTAEEYGFAWPIPDETQLLVLPASPGLTAPGIPPGTQAACL